MKKTRRTSGWVLLILAASLALWLYEQNFPAGESAAPASQAPTTGGDYEIHVGCRWVPHRGNDGDSFLCRLPDGRERWIRLYFADAPESAFRRYKSGETNHARILEQGRDLGGISPEEAVALGKKASAFTESILRRAPFTIHTQWDSPFNDDRFHAFVEVIIDGRSHLLHELLIREGLARVKTKGANLPNGTGEREQRQHLRNLQRQALRANR